jgi:ABC-2 type transport system permease protein
VTAEPRRPAGVIHDLGYRGYDGPRESRLAIARSLYVTGLWHAFGFGRSPRSRILPLLLLGLTLLPAVIVLGALVLVGLPTLPLTYARYAVETQVLVSAFTAAQAPVLLSRDLRHRSVVLYLARPLPGWALATVRLGSLVTAVLAVLVLPVLVLYAGALLAGLDAGEQTRDLLEALPLLVLLAGMLGGVGAVISAWALRRGFAVVGTIVALVVTSGVAATVQVIAREEGVGTVGEAAGLFSPWSLYAGLAARLDLGVDVPVVPAGGWAAAYLAMGVGLVLLCALLLLRRFRAVAAR